MGHMENHSDITLIMEYNSDIKMVIKLVMRVGIFYDQREFQDLKMVRYGLVRQYDMFGHIFVGLSPEI